MVSLTADLFKEYNKYRNITISRIGSGGRYDSGGVREQEFLVMTFPYAEDSDITDDEVFLVIESLRSGIDLVIKKFSQCIVEHKDLAKSDDSLLYHFSRPTHPYPGRILESEFIAGNLNLFIQTKLRVINALKSNPKLIKK